MNVALAYLAVIAVWATTPLAIKFSNHSLTPMAAVTSRMLLAAALAALLANVVFRAARLKRAHWRLYAIASLALFPNMPLVYTAAQYIPSGLISVMFALAPFFSGLWSIWLVGENPFTRLKLLGLLLALSGLVLVVYDQLQLSNGALVGIGLMLASTLLFSLSNVLVKRLGEGIHPLEQTLGALSFSLPGLLLSWWLVDGQLPRAVDDTSLLAVLYLATVGSLLGSLAFFYTLARLPVEVVVLVPVITPTLALALGSVLAGEHIGERVLFGAGLILLGLAVHELLPQLRRGWQLPAWMRYKPDISKAGGAVGVDLEAGHEP